MRPDLIIVNPGGGQTIYQALENEFTAIEPPLWCRLIAGYVRDRGYSVEIVDCAAGQTEIGKATLICIAAYGHQPNASTQSMEDAGRIAREIKTRNPDQPIIMVGGHVAALPEQTLREFPVDAVCSSDGPEAVVAMLGGHDGGVLGGTIADVAGLHGNAWDLLSMPHYRAHNWQCFNGSPRTPYASIYTTLGCPYQCVFCCINAPFGGKGYRRRKPRDVVDEAAMLYHAYGVQTLKITDEMFVLRPSHYTAICEGLAALPFADDLNIWAYARVDTVKPDTLALLRRAGIRWLALGIESGSAYVRDGADKALSDNDIVATVRAIQDAGINVIGNYIFGLPDDTYPTMRQTLQLALDLKCEFANFYSAMAYPGSPLHGMTPEENLPKTWSGYSQHSIDCTPLPTRELTAAQVLEFRDNAFRAYFEDEFYLETMEKKFGSDAVDQIRRMTAIRLERTYETA